MDKALTNKVKTMVESCSFLIKRDILVEELAELLEVINSPRLYINKWSNDKVIEEFADVYLMTWQMCMYLGEEDIESFIDNYDDIHNLQYKRVELSFLQKAMHCIWVVSKMRRESYTNKNTKNYTEFRAAIFLLADHLQTNMNNLHSTKSDETVDKIFDVIKFKVDRQLARIKEEKEEKCNGSNSAETSN